MEQKMGLHFVAHLLLIVGGLNWGLVGLFDFNLVHAIFGSADWLERLVYILVGIAAVVVIGTHRNYCKMCGPMGERHEDKPAQ